MIEEAAKVEPQLIHPVEDQPDHKAVSPVQEQVLDRFVD